MIVVTVLFVSWPGLIIRRSEERYPFEKSWRIDVNRTASLRNQRRSILALLLTDDLTVYKHWD